MGMAETDAIVIDNVVKRFKKRTIRAEYTTLKSELVRLLLRRDKRPEGSHFIEALRGIDLKIPKGKTVGIIGRNGSGKSTLLKLITGIYAPTTGDIRVDGRISALLDLGAGFHPDFSGRENILINGVILGMSRKDVRARMPEIIDFSELGEFIDEPVRTYSAGMYMRLAFSVATHVDPDILIIDEILAVGDEHFGRKSLAKMTEFKTSGRTIVLVSHDLSTVQRWCDLAVWIDGGKVRAMGDPHRVVADYRQAVALAEEQKLSLLPPALSPGGGALPELGVTATPTTGPQVPASRRWGNYRLELSSVVLSGASLPEGVFAPKDPLELTVSYLAHEEIPEVTFEVKLTRPDGLLVFGTKASAAALGLAPIPPGKGTVSLRLPRLGLAQGTYELELSAQNASGLTFDHQRGLHTFAVRGAGALGVLEPEHRWAGAREGASVLPRAAQDRA
jgi:lipopolysaccharide transport system ATP-binding protein